MPTQTSQYGAARARSSMVATTCPVWVFSGVGGTLRSEAGPAACSWSRYAASVPTVGCS